MSVSGPRGRSLIPSRELVRTWLGRAIKGAADWAGYSDAIVSLE
jgi:hypothetical protein